MKILSLVLVFQCFLLCVLVLDLDNVFVSAQGPFGSGFDFSSIVTAMLPHVPGKVIGLIQLGLLSRLLRQRRNRIDFATNGIDDDRDGLVDESDEQGLDGGQKKNVMVFMGKHNIQVSNHGINGDEEEDGGECEGDCCDDSCEDDEEGDEDEDDDEDEEDEEDDEDDHKKEKYKKEKYKSGNSYGDEDGSEDGYSKKGQKKKSKKYQKKSKKSSESYGDNKDKEDDSNDYNSADDSDQYTPYAPTMLFANSNSKQTLFPWLRKMFPISQMNTNPQSNEVESGVNGMNHIMSSPNGFPIGGSKLTNFKRRTGFSDNKNVYTDDVEELMTYKPSDEEINDLLSNPEVIEFLEKLNNTEDIDNIEKSLKRNKRQINFRENNNTFTAEETQEFVPYNPSKGLNSNTIKGFSNLLPNYLKNSLNYNQLFGQKSWNNRQSIKDSESLSTDNSLNHLSEPQESMKSFKSEDYFTFKPLSSKLRKSLMSSSETEPTYGEMSTTDDDKYSTSDVSDMTGGSHDTYGLNALKGMEGMSGMHEMSDYGNTGMYGGMDSYGPVMDLSYWSKVMKANQKKKNNKYSTTTESSAQGGYGNKDEDEEEEEDEDDDDYDEEGEDYEDEPPRKKKHVTIQVIKAGSKTGNIGSGSDCCEDDVGSTGSRSGLRSFMQRLPGFGRFGRG